jgi:chromosomal replication initiation ATPase DnaA
MSPLAFFPEGMLLKSYLTTGRPKKMLIDNKLALLEATAEVMGTTPEAIIGNRKTFAEALARQIVMTLWAEGHSLQASCEIVGRTHHTAAFYARRKIHERLQYCEHTRERMKIILQKYSQIILEQRNENQ